MKRFVKNNVILLALTVCLLTSAFINIILGGLVVKYYGYYNRICLDPAGLKVFAAKNLQLQEPPAGTVRVVLFGDSRINHWRQMPSLPNFQMINRGISGQTTAQALLRLDRDVIQLRPDVTIVQVGVNDLKTIGVFPESKDQIIDTCWENLSEIVNRMVDNNIDVILLNIFPPGSVELLRRPVWSNEIDNAIVKINEMMMSLKNQRVNVVDCNPILAPNKKIKPEYEKETLHLTAEAYQVLNSALNPILEEWLQKHRNGS